MKQARKRQLSLVAMAALLLALVVAVATFPAVPVRADEDVEAEDGTVYKWLNNTWYGGEVEGHWERFDPNGPPHPWNQDADNQWRIPDANWDDPYPYGAQVRTQSVERMFYWFNNSDSTDDPSGTWISYDPESGSHPANDGLAEGDARKEWAHPYWARTLSTDKGAPKPVGYWAAGDDGEDFYSEPEDEDEASVAPEDDPLGDAGSTVDDFDEMLSALGIPYSARDLLEGILDAAKGFFDDPP